ncbi:glycosyltransferase [Halomonas sp. GD1P12]|uniref:glycosyltransferase n=1 Tax=Halomonas sp. GD1P12 TaxID=2982691 RepID=UPI0021E42CB8|nr:glycosyltransferase [Halomonas sp. GD1P12]UYF98760.1 glycosyltransferase [Halomonas sp. GD1P12]
MDFYTRFTHHFRGDESVIKARLEVYLPVLAPVLARYPTAPVVDLGAGRGEWLELMRDNGWPASGIDTNESMAGECNARGLRVDTRDALTGLQALEDDSLSAVTGFHIAEHLPFDDLVALVQQAHRVLLPGGVLILETPNPENLTVGLWSFHLDPTHQRPLPPPLLHFLATDTGFANARIWRLNGPTPPKDSAPVRDYLDWVVSAYPDYALIAHKHTDDESAPWFEYLETQAQTQQGSLDTLAAKIEAQAEALADETDRRQRYQARVEQLGEELEGVYRSRSWRLTKPLRGVMHTRRQLAGAQGRLIRKTAQVPWLKRPALAVLNRFPALKMRVLKQMAGSSELFSRKGQFRPEDFVDLDTPVRARVRVEALTLRDTTASVSALRGLRLEGHVNGSYSLAAVNRHLLTRLAQSDNPPALWLAPHEALPEKRVNSTPGGEAEAARLNGLLDPNPWQALAPNERIALYHRYPLITPDPAFGTAVALFFWEESAVPADMIDTLNRHYHGVIVTAWFVKKVLMDSGCRLPIHVVTLPLVENPLAAESQALDLERASQGRPVHLLHVSSAFPRKGVDVLLQAFERLAGEDSALTLTLKSFPNPHNQVEALIETYVSSAYRPRLTLIMEDYSAEQMAALYQKADIVVLPTRGEGLNMPAIEAGEFSRGLVVTGFGAHTDFLSADTTGFIDYCFDHAQSHFQNDQALWVEPGVDSTVAEITRQVQALRLGGKHAYAAPVALNEAIRARFFAPGAVASILAALARLKALTNTAAPALSVSLFSTWREACGIAQYSDHLLEALSHDDAIALTVHAPTAPLDGAAYPVRVAEKSWQKGASPALSGASGNVVWLQHHFAFFELDTALAREVVRCREQGKRVYITLHTTRPLIDFDTARRRAAAATLAEFDRVFVHTLDDLNHLKRIGLTDNVTRMPQGVAQSCEATVEATPSNGAPIIGCFGFLLPHKGVNTLIEAFAALIKRQALPEGARLRLVTSVRDEPASQEELARCQRTAKRLGVERYLEWYTDFMPLDEVQRRLAECSLVVLPYQYTQESSSAAVRTAVAACPMILTTPAPIFDEVAGVVWQSDGFEPEAIASAVVHVLSANEQERAVYRQARADWLEQRRWATLARRYQALMNAALVDQKL